MTLVNTLMQDLRSQYGPQYDKHEQRASKWGAFRFFLQESENRPIFDAETIANIQASFERSVIVPVLDAEVIAATTPYTRTCNIADSENTSQLVTLTFATYGFGFSMTPSQHMENDVSYQNDFNRKMQKFERRLGIDLDTLCVNTLDGAINQLWTDIAPDFYAQVADALQVPQANKDDFYNNLESILAVADYYDGVHVVTNNNHMPMVRRLDNQGAANANNQGFQFQGGGSQDDGQSIRAYTFWPTNRIGNGAGVESTGYAVNAGSVFLATRNDPDARAGGAIGGDFKQWSEERLPETGLVVGSFYQQDCADQSGLGGSAASLTRTRKEGFEFSTDVTVATVYNSSIGTRYNPIFKFEVLT